MMLKSLAALVAMTGAAFAGGSGGFPPITMPNMVLGTTLADSTEPGSVLVFPEFMQGSVEVFSGSKGAFNSAVTVIEISAKCPKLVDGDGGGCPEQPLKLHTQWVCPGVVGPGETAAVCPESDFIVPITFGSFAEGTITFNPSAIPSPPGSDYNGSTIVPIAPCPKGFLVAYAEDSTGHPVKFDGLTGTARLTNSGGWGSAAYKAIAIQADPNMTNWELDNDASGVARMALGPGGALIFDGGTRHYMEVTGQASGQVSWDSTLHLPFHRDRLILMSLDVKSGQPNEATAVGIDFFNRYEAQQSYRLAFVCWGEFPLETISPFLTVEGFGSDNNGFLGNPTTVGDFSTGQAQGALSGTPKTLLGIERSNVMGDPATNWGASQFLREFFNNSVPIPTQFVPEQL